MEASSDSIALAEKLRREDPEQFHTLVRMHLSFVLDLNTDDLSEPQMYDGSTMHCPGNVLHVLSSIWKDAYGCMQSLRSSQNHQHVSNIESECYDCNSEKAKSRLQKWSFVPFSKKGKSTGKGIMEGAPLTQEGICQVYQLIEFLSKDQNVCQEGIFRRSGKLTRQQELKSLLNQGVPLNLDDGNFSVHDCASVLKNFLAELPESLLTDAHYPAYCQIAEMCGGISGSNRVRNWNENRLLRALQLLLLLLPPENRVLLKDILCLLHLTASHESSNKMSSDSLATLFTPHLLCPHKLTPEAIHVNSQTMSGVIAFMIQQGATLFDIPPKLATDICAYLAERERRKLSPKKEMNESVCDGTAANTVFTFVDRERTAQAHVTNPTETALAQLYAHIQSLPESSKKKRLIKQFNKENGQGTPLQASMRRKNHQRSKSLGDSIKKHIFFKGTKRQKNSNVQGQCSVSRSLSQEVLNKPGTCIRLFQKSMEEDLHSLTYQNEMPETSKSSANDTNCVLLQLRYSMLNNITPERSLNVSNNKSTSESGTKIGAKKAVLKNLTNQIGINQFENETNELCSDSILGTRKRLPASVTSETSCENGCSPPKNSCYSADPDLLSSSHSPPTPCQSGSEPSSRDQGTDTWPVSNCAAALPASCCDRSVDALPGFFSPPPLLGNTNNKLTPRNVLTFLTTSTPASQSRLRASNSTRGPIDANHSSCLLTPIADENNSMSPITRSTQKMPKAMQETMMTPRCRKPVVLVSGSNLCHLASLETWGSRCKQYLHDHDSCSSVVDDENIVNSKENYLTRNFDDSSCIGHTALKPSDDSIKSSKTPVESEENMNMKTAEAWPTTNTDVQLTVGTNDSDDSGSLTSTFRSYLLNRSVLTSSPVDLSFSSRTGDFDTLDTSNEEKILQEEKLSSSLLYCLDGGNPADLCEEDIDDVYGSCSIASREPKTFASQKQLIETTTKESDSQSYGTNEREDVKFNNVKYSSTEALTSNSVHYNQNVIHETSL